MMKTNARSIIQFTVIIIVGLYFMVQGLVAAKSFLAPLSIAILLTMVFVPLSNKMEAKGLNRGLSTLTSVLITVIAFAGMFAILTAQVNSIAQDWPKIQKQLQPTLEKTQQFLQKEAGIPIDKQQEVINKYIPGQSSGNSSSSTKSSGDTGSSQSETPTRQQSQQATGSSQGSSLGGMASKAGHVALQFFNFIGNALLVFIYMFFFLYYRNKVKNSILRFFDKEKRPEASQVLNQSIKVSQSYLVGRLLLILFLAIIYTVGMLLSGVQNAILISLIAALLSLVPYVGVVIGYVLAMAMAGFSGGSTMAFVGVTITYSLAQFVESYILEPYLVGKKVDLNPLITIIVVVLGGAMWGVVGMIISIPVFGILKNMFDHIPSMQPMGYLLGEEGIGNDEEESLLSKAGSRIKKKVSGKG